MCRRVASESQAAAGATRMLACEYVFGSEAGHAGKRGRARESDRKRNGDREGERGGCGAAALLCAGRESGREPRLREGRDDGLGRGESEQRQERQEGQSIAGVSPGLHHAILRVAVVVHNVVYPTRQHFGDRAAVPVVAAAVTGFHHLTLGEGPSPGGALLLAPRLSAGAPQMSAPQKMSRADWIDMGRIHDRMELKHGSSGGGYSSAVRIT